jgi:hypothetical protein
MIHSTLPGDSPTHYKVKDITGTLEILHGDAAGDDHHGGDKHISTKEDHIVNIDRGHEILQLGRPHGTIGLKEKDQRDSRAPWFQCLELIEKMNIPESR